ncbi:MAG: hypothetical protein LKF75_00645 [Bacilli bacterium]|jgi:hypothetical protein|nr:hypothetical protein [Bacilli bacterium]MCH4210259.1 hypothetical protein [Bacilli bacterium]MCH4228209.1 hypothetical protein [Bacilli bacterium]MCH4277437.1 hypothetical protein [Bacilli bacterium]MCI2054661.1 hypothetical protein [Bacilli bacterium]
MPQYVYIIIAVVMIVLLLALFVWSFVAYRRAPVPKGCENIKVDDETCSNCSNGACFYKKKLEDKKKGGN